MEKCLGQETRIKELLVEVFTGVTAIESSVVESRKAELTEQRLLGFGGEGFQKVQTYKINSGNDVYNRTTIVNIIVSHI